MQYNFISPHIDDAFLSMGGTILSLLAENKCLQIQYVFSLSNWTNPDSLSSVNYPADVPSITKIRKAEEASISNLAGYTCDFLDFPDMPLRQSLSEADNLLLAERIKEKLRTRIHKDDVCVFPVGLIHPDHILVNRLGKQLQSEGYTVVFYEDMPYHASGSYTHSHFYKEVCQLGLVPCLKRIDFYKKASLLECYKSQVSPLWLKDMMNYAYCVQDDQYYERWWKTRNSETIM